VVHIDADLYTSAHYVLTELGPHMTPGTVLIFDEFFDREHELRAFEQFLERTGARTECIGATSTLTQAAFRLL
ncbi:MAG: class I SAM-dependent methyltransferase, partial [Candidatus Eremiobacterota bacterium]